MAQRWSCVLCLLVVGCASTHPEQARVVASQPAPGVATAPSPAKPAAPVSPAPAPQPTPPAPPAKAAASVPPTPPPPQPTPSTSTTGASATAPAHGCIVIQAKTEPAGLREEGKWLREHFPGWTKAGQSLLVDEKNQRFDSIDIVSPTGEKRTVCFDINNFFGKF